jgi:nitroimidazol reductase NimA-like FMN-containing flavoprotein (pyridoxamine 5'-phosphate oxidase superfamily)
MSSDSMTGMSTANGGSHSTTEVLSQKECWELLRESVVGRLAVTVGGSPDIFPVNPVVDHGSIVFRTSAGTKLAAAKGNDVAFEVDGYDPGTGRAWSVVVKGRTSEVWDVEDTIRALRLPLVPWQPGRKPRFVRIEPDTVTGRRFTVAGGFTTTTPPTRTTSSSTMKETFS